MVVAQLEEWSLPALEDPGSNPAINNLKREHLFSVNCIKKTKLKKRGRVWPIFNEKSVNIVKAF